LEDLSPSEVAEAVLVGVDTGGVNNRLLVVDSSRFQIDPTFAGISTPGRRYTFSGPSDHSADPIQLGFKLGDKIQLKQAFGQPIGPNNNRLFTIYDPATLSVLETITVPDTTLYKFFAIKRGL
jgi:hypothetical protein